MADNLSDLEMMVAMATARGMARQRGSDVSDILGLAQASDDLSKEYDARADKEGARTHRVLAAAYRKVADELRPASPRLIEGETLYGQFSHAIQ